MMVDDDIKKIMTKASVMKKVLRTIATIFLTLLAIFLWFLGMIQPMFLGTAMTIFFCFHLSH